MKLHWGNAIFIFFSIFLSLAAVFIVFSLRQNNDLVEDNYYEKGANFSKQIEINRRSLALTDSIILKNKGEQISITVCDNIIRNATEIQVHFYRPSEKMGDFMIAIKPQKEPILIDKENLQKGRYIVKLSWNMSSLDYGLEKDFFVE